MDYPQQNPHYYQPPPMQTAPIHGQPVAHPHGPHPPHHQPQIMPPGPQQPHHPHHQGYYPINHSTYQPPQPSYQPPQQPMSHTGQYMAYSQPHQHYYQPPPMQPAPIHGQPVAHPHGPQTPHHQPHILTPGPQQTHPGYYPMQHPTYQPPQSAYQPPQPSYQPPQPMPQTGQYMAYSQPHQHYYQPPPMQPVPIHGQPVAHPHRPHTPHHQPHIMTPGPQQAHPGYYPMQHPPYQPPQQQPPPTQPQMQPHPTSSQQPPPLPPQPMRPTHDTPPRSPHQPSSRGHTPTKTITAARATPSVKIEKTAITFPKNSVEATKPTVTKRRKFTSKDVTDIEVWRLLMCLKSGLLAESSWAIDVLSILLNDDSTSLYFGLQHMPGMLEAILEHFKCCLNAIFRDMNLKDTTLKAELCKPVNYSHWQEGNGEDMSYIQVYYEPHNTLETSKRCICISTLLRNLSFIPGNDVEMSKHAGLLLILGKVLLYKPDHDDHDADEWHLLNSLREDALVIISNISSSLDLSPYNDKINLSLLKGLLHWACCSTTYALDPFPPPTMVSPQRLSLESLAKLSIIEGNVDLILATPPWTRIEKLFEVLTNMLNMNEDQTIREFSLVLLSNLAAADSGIARKVALTGNAISRLVSFLETSIADPDTYATTQDMLRRAALTLKCLSQLLDNHPLFANCQQRLLNLVMSQKLDPEVVPIIADVIFEISLSY